MKRFQLSLYLNIIFSILIFLLFIYSAIWGDKVRMLSGILLYAGISIYHTKVKMPKVIRLIYLMPLFISWIISFSEWPKGLVTLPSIITPVAVYLLVWLGERKKALQYSIAIIFSFAGIWWYSSGFSSYKSWVVFKRVQSSSIIPSGKSISFKSQGGITSLPDVHDKEKIYVLDFWHTKCGPCFASFPKLSEEILRLNPLKKIEIFAVAIPFPDQNLDSIHAVLNRQRVSGDIHPAISLNPSFLENEFGLTVVPTTYVVRGKEIMFKGELDGAISKALQLANQ